MLARRQNRGSWNLWAQLSTLRHLAAGSRCVTLALLLAAGISATPTAAQTSAPLACVAAAPDDPEPWLWNSRILASFQSDTPKPKFAGAFSDERSRYELHLWRDSKGVFGELLNPVLNSDSPTSRLYDAHIDSKTGTLNFAVRFMDGARHFSGKLPPDSMTGTLQYSGRSEAVVWRKLRAIRMHGAASDSYGSRAQFECAMILFRRY